MSQTLFAHDPTLCGAGTLRLGNPTICPVPPPPTPGSTVPPGGGGDPWWDRDKDPTDFLNEVHRLGYRRVILEPVIRIEPGATSRVQSTTLSVSVHVSILSVQVVVDRGNKIHFIATFAGKPDEVHFSFIPPGKRRPVVDPGFGQPGSQIRQVDEWVFVYTMDTTKFVVANPDGEDLEDWHMWGTGEFGASAFEAADGEKIRIPYRKPQLL